MDFNKDAPRVDTRNRILHFIFDTPNATRPLIAKELTLSLPTVLQHVGALLDAGFIIETGKDDTVSGRKPRILEGVKDAAFALGLDISSNHVVLLHTNLCGEVLSLQRVRLKFENTSHYYQTIGELLDAYIDAQQISEHKILGVGIAVPASVSADGSYTSSTQLLLSDDLGRITLKYFKQHIKYECVLVNDANAAVMAEFSRNSRRHDNAIYLSLSAGVGGAIIVHGEVYEGKTLRSGEFGHTILIPNGRKCFCGASGCSQMYLSSRFLSKYSEDSLDSFFKNLNKNEKLEKVWDVYLTHLSFLIYNLHMSFDCPIIIGGYVGGYIENHLVRLNQKLRDINPNYYEEAYVYAGHYKIESSALGAALVYINRFLDTV